MKSNRKKNTTQRHPSRGLCRLLAVETAVPGLVVEQRDLEPRMARLWNLRGQDRSRWKRIVAGSGIERRHGVMPIEEIVHLSTADRMRVYEDHAPPLADEAARRALSQARLTPESITDLIVVTCTGFSAPGIDVALIDRLSLRPTVRRTIIGFMGCFGAIPGVRTAIGACAADPDATALVVCVELCSLHMRADTDPQNLVASALFADGAAAAIVTGTNSPDRHSIAQIGLGDSRLLPRGRDDMTWRITDHGFAMTLELSVLSILREWIEDARRTKNAFPVDEKYLVHPGGPKILDAIEDGLHLERNTLIESRRVLREFGNMSSPTVLFVLKEALRTNARSTPAGLIAFGPGLTVEHMPVLINPSPPARITTSPSAQRKATLQPYS